MKLIVNLTFLAFLVPSFVFFPEITSAESTPLRLGIMSDSSSDEYRADDNRGGGTPYAATTLNWVELLVRYRNVDVGSWGTRSLPRRTGYEYNWARSGAEASHLISEGQHTGLAQQVTQDKIDLVYFSIGGNDFAYYRDGADIYNGTLAGASLDFKINTFVNNYMTAIDTIRAVDTDIPIIAADVGDMGILPQMQQAFPDPVKRQRVTDAVTRTNQLVNQRLASAGYQNIIILDTQALASALFGSINSSGYLVIGGENINFRNFGDEPHYATLSDGLHIGTVLSGIMANMIIPYINQAANTDIPVFSEYEMIANAGISPQITPPPSPTPSQSPQFNQADINQDGIVDLTDYSILALQFLQTGLNLSADLNQDGIVDLTDYSILALNFLKQGP